MTRSSSPENLNNYQFRLGLTALVHSVALAIVQIDRDKSIDNEFPLASTTNDFLTFIETAVEGTLANVPDAQSDACDWLLSHLRHQVEELKDFDENQNPGLVW